MKRIIEELGNQFRGDKYHLMNSNCNHFTQAVTQVSNPFLKICFTIQAYIREVTLFSTVVYLKIKQKYSC